MTITNKFTGVGVALITPFDSKGSIDFGALAAIIDRVIDGGVDYLLALGTGLIRTQWVRTSSMLLLTALMYTNNSDLMV